jgi:hypothetical protein
MYIELLTTAVGIQERVAAGFTASGRIPELGLYFLSLNYLTVAFFENLDPPASCIDLHARFLEWERLGISALEQELKTGMPLDSEAARNFGEAGRAFGKALSVLTLSPKSY